MSYFEIVRSLWDDLWKKMQLVIGTYGKAIWCCVSHSPVLFALDYSRWPNSEKLAVIQPITFSYSHQFSNIANLMKLIDAEKNQSFFLFFIVISLHERISFQFMIIRSCVNVWNITNSFCYFVGMLVVCRACVRCVFNLLCAVKWWKNGNVDYIIFLAPWERRSYLLPQINYPSKLVRVQWKTGVCMKYIELNWWVQRRTSPAFSSHTHKHSCFHSIADSAAHSLTHTNNCH